MTTCREGGTSHKVRGTQLSRPVSGVRASAGSSAQFEPQRQSVALHVQCLALRAQCFVPSTTYRHSVPRICIAGLTVKADRTVHGASPISPENGLEPTYAPLENGQSIRLAPPRQRFCRTERSLNELVGAQAQRLRDREA